MTKHLVGGVGWEGGGIRFKKVALNVARSQPFICQMLQNSYLIEMINPKKYIVHTLTNSRQVQGKHTRSKENSARNRPCIINSLPAEYKALKYGCKRATPLRI